jgi:hypothetical protein
MNGLKWINVIELQHPKIGIHKMSAYNLILGKCKPWPKEEEKYQQA